MNSTTKSRKGFSQSRTKDFPIAPPIAPIPEVSGQVVPIVVTIWHFHVHFVSRHQLSAESGDAGMRIMVF
jgi:hypothetical protein